MSRSAQASPQQRPSTDTVTLKGASMAKPASAGPAPASAAKGASPLSETSFRTNSEILRAAQPSKEAIQQKTVQVTKVVTERSALQNPAKVKKVVAKTTTPRPVSVDIITRFMRWLEGQLKALIDKFFQLIPTFLKPTTFLSKRHSEGRGAKTPKEMAVEKDKKKDIEKKAKPGPSVRR
jgi:hypothetical protein